MKSTGATQQAGIEGELIDNKGRTAKESVVLEIFTDLASWGLLEAGQGEVRAELAVVRFQAKVEKSGSDLAVQKVQRCTFFNPGPDDARLAAWRKKADPLQLQRKLRHGDLGQRLADIEEGGAVDFTDETEGEVKLFRWGPAGARQAAAEQGQMIANGLWRVDGDEEALVHGRWFWEERIVAYGRAGVLSLRSR